MVEFRILSDQEVEALDLLRQPSVQEEIERERAVNECRLTVSGHDWELELEHPEDGAGITLSCTRCPAAVDDVYPDGHDLIWLEFDGVTVQDGKHDSPVPLVVPVDVDVVFGSHWTDYGMEYDAELQLSQRAPARPISAMPDEVA